MFTAVTTETVTFEMPRVNNEGWIIAKKKRDFNQFLEKGCKLREPNTLTSQSVKVAQVPIPA